MAPASWWVTAGTSPCSRPPAVLSGTTNTGHGPAGHRRSGRVDSHALVGYHLDPVEGLGLAREVNDEISSMTRRWPDRFAGLATLPVQDVDVAIGELQRAVTELGLKGAALDTVVNASNWDEELFLPLFKAAEQLGALLFYHPQPNNNLISQQVNDKYAFGNSIGVPLEDALVVSA